jgi:succinate-semialdehyde dehydrogenase/glutarate-semialdehyde dehydrogenase
LRDKLHEQVQSSLRAGARLRLGGEVPSRAGAFYPATVLSDVQPGMAAFDEELFGPVAAVVAARDTEHAIELANATSYGLGASVLSADVRAAEAIARGRLEAGMTFVNAQVHSDARLPFGGIKSSGMGRELGVHGVREFTNVKTVWVG